MYIAEGVIRRDHDLDISTPNDAISPSQTSVVQVYLRGTTVLATKNSDHVTYCFPIWASAKRLISIRKNKCQSLLNKYYDILCYGERFGYPQKRLILNNMQYWAVTLFNKRKNQSFL